MAEALYQRRQTVRWDGFPVVIVDAFRQFVDSSNGEIRYVVMHPDGSLSMASENKLQPLTIATGELPTSLLWAKP